MAWEPQGLGATIYNERYTRFEGETWAQGAKRVADHVAAAEDDGLTWYGRFYKELVSNRFMPGGRIWYGSGRPKAQLLNCFVVPVEDSREGWGQLLKEHVIIAGTGGGLGINFSPIRPRGSPIRGIGGTATGAVSLMRIVDATGAELMANSRRTALMFDLDITHPDLPEFLDAKLDRSQLTNANVSVVLTLSPHEFQQKVDKGEKIEFEFGGRKVGGYYPARDLFNKLVANAVLSGEPGVLNGHVANQMSNIFYHAPLISTNPCGEIWLEAYGCCDLGALVLPRFVKKGGMDWDLLSSTISIAVRFLDDVLTVNHYPFDAIKENCERVRRIGLGVMGLHSMLLALGLRYSSEEGLSFTDRLFHFIKTEAYKTSIELAKEKGTFPAFDARMMESGFAQSSLPEDTREEVRKHGIRNCAILTIPPTGTTGMVSGVSTGIEPLFAPAYWRRYYKNGSNGTRALTRELVVTPEFAEYGEIAEGAYDISPNVHFRVQKVVQQHIDNAVSKTINLPENYTGKDLAGIWLSYLPYVKGTTIYRSGSRGEEPLEPIPVQDIKKYTDMDATITFDPQDQAAMDCVNGVCEVSYASV